MSDDDPILAAIAHLRSHDVSAHRADRLRRRCHEMLDQRRQRSVERRFAGMPVRRVVVPALASAWCAVYLCEILLRAATVYGLWVR